MSHTSPCILALTDLTLTMLRNHSALRHPLEFHCSKRKADVLGESLQAHYKPGETVLHRKSGNTCYLLATVRPVCKWSVVGFPRLPSTLL